MTDRSFKNFYVSHDSNRIKCWVEGPLDLTLEHASKMSDDLDTAIRQLKTRSGPPAPSPLYVNDDNKLISENEAYCGDDYKLLKKGVTVLAEIGSYRDEVAKYGYSMVLMGEEVELDILLRLREWINKAEKYYKGEK